MGSRVTSQGLVGAQASGNRAAVVELNCETDFVASCDAFKELVSFPYIELYNSVIFQLEEVTAAALEASKSLQNIGLLLIPHKQST